MAHQCTSCGHLFPDGSKEMLSGCPSCGGNKFQFKPGAVEDFEGQPVDEPTASSLTDSDQAVDTFDPSDSPSEQSSTPQSTPAESTPSNTSTNSPESTDSPRSTDSHREPTESSPTPTESSTASSAQPDEQTTRNESADSGGLTGHEWPETARRDPAHDEEPRYRPWPTPDDTDNGSDTSASEFGRDAEVVSNNRDDAGSEAPAQSTARSDIASSDEVNLAGGNTRRANPADQPTESDQSTQPEHPTHSTQPDEQDQRSQPVSSTNSTTPNDSTDASVDALRRELNEQFESIRIVSPGHYELNLMELYDREEYIISLREDGRYVIEVPDSWSGD